MQFIYHANSGDSLLIIDKDLHKYLFKVRRSKVKDNIFLRNLENNFIYKYQIISIDKKQAQISLISKEYKEIKTNKSLHIGWCIVDPKTIEKEIASLNELGVTKISFIYCNYSQKQYKINFEKLEKILINSSQQCGRSSIIKLEVIDSFEEFLGIYPNSYMFNFSSNRIDTQKDNIETIIVGCEGGFSKSEVENFNQDKIVGINSNMILRSETAIVSITSKILL